MIIAYKHSVFSNGITHGKNDFETTSIRTDHSINRPPYWQDEHEHNNEIQPKL